MPLGRIYKISADPIHTNDCYIGSTFCSLKKRIGEHRGYFKTDKKITSKQIIKYDTHVIELLEEVSVENVEQLRKIEGCYIKKTPNCINRYIAGRTKKEYADEHKEENKKRCKKWYYDNLEKCRKVSNEKYAKNKVKYLEQMKKRYAENPELRIKKRAISKKWQAENRARVNELARLRHAKNKDKVLTPEQTIMKQAARDRANAKKREKVKCPKCETVLCRGALGRHKKNNH